MKRIIVEINSGNYGSTGNIMLQIADMARKQGHTVYVAFPASRDNQKKTIENAVVIGSRFSRNIHLILSKLTGLNGCFSFFATWKFLRTIKKLKVDIIHLHNLHNCYINLPLLFRFIKKNHIQTVWTLHDCWAYTGQCPHYDMSGCRKWKTACYDCPQYRSYPASLVDQTRLMHRLKKKWFSGVKDLTLVTPSQWLAGQAKQSFLKDYPVQVIYNGIDLSAFQPVQNDFREKYCLQNKYMLLGVAFGWGSRKGLDVFLELSKRLDESYQIVLVGTDDEIDRLLPDNMISIHRTANQKELAKIYTAADLFVNPTREETLGLVNIEANACGTPVVTFHTGGSPECIDEASGKVVAYDDIDALEQAIRDIERKKPFAQSDCIRRAQYFDKYERIKEYVKLYEKAGHP